MTWILFMASRPQSEFRIHSWCLALSVIVLVVLPLPSHGLQDDMAVVDPRSIVSALPWPPSKVPRETKASRALHLDIAEETWRCHGSAANSSWWFVILTMIMIAAYLVAYDTSIILSNQSFWVCYMFGTCWCCGSPEPTTNWCHFPNKCK